MNKVYVGSRPPLMPSNGDLWRKKNKAGEMAIFKFEGSEWKEQEESPFRTMLSHKLVAYGMAFNEASKNLDSNGMEYYRGCLDATENILKKYDEGL